VIRLGSSGDDTYSADELGRIALLVEPGGHNLYQGPAAAAGAGVRVDCST
jgi:hypothetical protein